MGSTQSQTDARKRIVTAKADASDLTFISVTSSPGRWTDARGFSHPIYNFDYSVGDPPLHSMLGLRFIAFQDLAVAIRGEMQLQTPFPPSLSKWKRYVMLSDSCLRNVASLLDAWMREIFSLRPSWSVLVSDAMSVFMDSAVVDSSKKMDSRQILARQASTERSFAAFLSHFKWECGTEARLIHDRLSRMLPDGNQDIFLDSDDLYDLRGLLEYVKSSNVLVLLQSKSVLMRPWVIMELYTAITNRVPIVALNVQNANPYNYKTASEFLLYFDKDIDIANPGAAQLLIDHGVDPLDCAYLLSEAIPNIISIDFNPNGSARQIQASLADLVEAVGHAAAFESRMSKEEWFAWRAASTREKRKSSIPKQVHRKSANASPRPSIAAAAAAATSTATPSVPATVLADIPLSVPELPDAYLVRDKDISELKTALLATNGPISAALTSKTKSKRSAARTSAHGMGGIGKTTIATALVHDEEIRAAFDKIVWVSVGQEPDIRELQESVHGQLEGEAIPASATTPELVQKALRDAAKGSKILVVLDDIWIPIHEKLLNCIDPDNGSRLLVTTRIRNILKNSHEVSVGVLVKSEALELLLSSAGVREDTIHEGGNEHRIALEIVELCGRLPLTLAIAGGMIRNNPEKLTDEVVELMKEDRLREQDDEEGGTTLEERVIASSLKMIQGKNAELVVKVFSFFAVFPEDVPIPAGVFNALALMIASNYKDHKKAKISIGGSLCMLLDYNLLKGSLSLGSGVFMHDIVRDYVINQYQPSELHSLQKRVVDAVLAARPNPSGFPTSGHAAIGSFEGYVARQLFWHFQGALENGEEPPEEWLTHPDTVVISNAAMGVGLNALVTLSEAKEAAGNLVRAARISWAASQIKGIAKATRFDLIYRTADLLETAANDEAVMFELKVISAAFSCELGSRRHRKCQNHAKVVVKKGGRTFESKICAALSFAGEAFHLFGAFGDLPNFEGAVALLLEHNRLYAESADLTDDPTWRSYNSQLMPLTGLGLMVKASHKEIWNPTLHGCSEKGMIKACEFYQYHVCSPKMKETGMQMDYFRAGHFLPITALWYGNCDMVQLWHQKTLVAFQEINPSVKDYNDESGIEEFFEIYGCVSLNVTVIMMLGLFEETCSMLTVLGFTWDKMGFERITNYFSQGRQNMLGINLRVECVHSRLLIFLSSPTDIIDENEVNDWIPSPQEIIDMEAGYPMMNALCTFDLSSLSARAFLKLGRHNDAYELSRLAVSPERDAKKITQVICYCVLGEVASKRGNADEAESHFTNALKIAEQSRLPMLQVLVAREWEKHILKPNKKDCSTVESVVDTACKKMNKTREQIANVLDAGWYNESTAKRRSFVAERRNEV